MTALAVTVQERKEPRMLPGDVMIHDYLKKRAEELSKNFMAGAKPKAE